MAAAELPRGVRAAANRAARPRRPPAPGSQLAEAARAGLLTRSNTRAGTAGRQAVDRLVYERRQAAGERKGLAPGRAAAGHEPPGGRPRSLSALLDNPPRWVLLDDASRGEARRIARYDALLSGLVQGSIGAREFRRRVASWRPLRGERFLADPGVALAILDVRREAGDEVFVYVGRRS